MAKDTKGNRGLKTGSVFKEVERDDRGRPVKTFWVVRKRYVGRDGRPREKKRTAHTYQDALEKKRDIEREIADELSGREVEPERTFEDLAAYYKKHYLKPPEYVGDRKVSGMRSYHGSARYQFEYLAAHFGARPLRSVTYDDLRALKERLLATPAGVTESNRRGRQRSVADVNRKLSLLRRMLNVAERMDWVDKNPFRRGDPLISLADEHERMRVLTHDEEERLLAACGAKDRSGRDRYLHLRPLIVAALDTGARQGELFKLRPGDVDLAAGVIEIRAFITKTMRRRTAPVSSRLRAELEGVLSKAEERGDGLLFGLTNNIKKAFTKVRELAGLPDVHFHDLRHTAIVWMLEAGENPAKVMKIVGHSNWKTFQRYISLTEETAKTTADRLDAYREMIEAGREKKRRSKEEAA